MPGNLRKSSFIGPPTRSAATSTPRSRAKTTARRDRVIRLLREWHVASDLAARQSDRGRRPPVLSCSVDKLRADDGDAAQDASAPPTSRLIRETRRPLGRGQTPRGATLR